VVRPGLALLFAGAVVGLFAGGCGSSSPFDGTTLLVEAQNLGISDPRYTFTLLIYRQSDGKCPLSPAATATVNGLSEQLGGNCFMPETPFEQTIGSVTIDVQDGGYEAKAEIDGLTPGNDPSLLLTPAGETTTSGSFSVALPPAFQGLVPVVAEFIAVPSPGNALTFPTVDGSPLAIPAPPTPGDFQMFVDVQPPPPSMDEPGGIVSACSGFQRCDSLAAETLGPFDVSVVAGP
jgi:hypothetical protein